LRDKPCHVHTGNEGVLPFPADLETHLSQRQLLKTISTNSKTGSADASSSATGQNAAVATSASSNGRECMPSATHLDLKSQSSIHALRSKLVPAKGQDLCASLTAS